MTYHVFDFTSVGVHATGSLSGLDVSPNHRDHVSLIVHLSMLVLVESMRSERTHETTIEVGSVIRVSTLDVSETTREGILEEVEHGEELSRGPIAVSLIHTVL